MYTRVLGRDPELGEVDDFLCAAGRSFQALVLEGEPGIGKTTLWREARRRAEQRGYLTLRCRPSAAEAKLSFAALADLLDPLDDERIAGLPEPQREALGAVLLRAGFTQTVPSARAVAAGFLALVRQLASIQPIVLGIDDWQWLDPPSRRVLEFAARRLEAERVGLLCTAPSPRTDPPIGGAVADDRLRRLPLTPLSVPALGAITANQLGTALPRPLLVRISEATRGNPSYALEIARLIIDRGIERPSPTLPVPDDLRALALSRIRPLPPDARAAVLLASMLASPTIEMIDANALAPAEDARIVTVDDSGRIDFAHPILASAIYASASIGRRRELHRRAAQLVSDPEQRARHRALSSDDCSRSVAEELDEAAALAASRGMPGRAAELAELAAQRTPCEDAGERTHRLISAGRLQFEAGDLARAEALASAVLSADGAGPERAGALRLSAQLAARRTSLARAADLAAEALSAAGDDRIRAGIELDLAEYAISRGELAGARLHAAEAVARAEAGGEGALLEDALALRAMADFLSGMTDDGRAMARAQKLGGPLRAGCCIPRSSIIPGILQLWTGELQAAVETIDAVCTDHADRGIEGFASAAAFYRVWASVWSGNLDQATRWSTDALASAELLDDPSTSAVALAAAALVRAYDGTVDEARKDAAAARALFERLEWRIGSIWPAWALGLAELSDQNPVGADAVLRPLADQVAAMGTVDPALTPFVPDAVEAMTQLGDVALAEAYLAPFLKRSKRLGRAWAVAAAERCRGELEGARGEPRAASAAFERALAAHDGAGMPLERARTLLVAGRVARRFKQRGRAREQLGEALAVFEEFGAGRWAANARSELERVGWPGGRGTELTETEQRIAALVAEGLTNQQIAGRAFLSVKTVEANLTRIYRKLGLGSRVALANAWRPQDPIAGDVALTRRGFPLSHSVVLA